MKTLMKACLLSLLLMMHGAFAADLKTAKEQGWVGEQNNGYLGLVKSDAPADLKALVADVNGQRRAQFTQIATKKWHRRSGSGEGLCPRSGRADLAGKLHPESGRRLG